MQTGSKFWGEQVGHEEDNRGVGGLSSDFERKAAPWTLRETSVCPLCSSVTSPLPSSSFQLGFQLAEHKGGNREGKRKAEEDHGSMVGSVGEWGLARMGVWMWVGVAHFL